MRPNIFFIVMFLLGPFMVGAQTYSLSGSVTDAADNTTMPGASVKLVNQSDTTQWQGQVTDANGVFTFSNLANGNYHIIVTYIGYQAVGLTVAITGADKQLMPVALRKGVSRLKEVEIVAAEKHYEQKADTTVYNANAYKVNPDASAEDLVNKMPGISSSNGTVTAHGETVQQVYVDGKEFFGQDASLALKSLPAEVIDKVQVFDKMSDQAQFTGFDDGNTQKAINITTKRGKSNGLFGKVYAGYGYITDSRYSAGALLNWFSGDRRITLIGMSNNVNLQNFSTQDLLGVLSSSSGRGGGMMGGGGGRHGGGGFGGGANVNNFLIGSQGGISTTHSVGLNYSDMWGKKLRVTGSYFFNYVDNENSTALNRQYINQGDSSEYYKENNTTSSKNFNHRLNLRLEYTIDSANKIIFSPRLNFQQNKQANTIDGYTTIGPTEFLSKTQSIYNSSYWGYNLSGDVLYQHRFPKRRRTLSLDVSGTFNNKTGDATQTAISSYGVVEDSTSLNQQANSSTSSYTVSGDASYTEPAGKTGMVQINYSPSYTWNKADKETSNYDSLSMAYSGLDTLLSNKYDNTYMTHRGGVSYRYSNRAMHFMLGVDAQYALLSGQEVFPYSFSLNRSFINVLPHAMFTYRFKNNSNLRLFYRTSTSPPTVTQLQSVIDNSNPLLLTTGNPDLKQSYTHNVMLRYGLAGGSKEQAFFAFAAVSYTQQYVANSTIIAQRDTLLANDILLRAGSQLTQPVNLNGNLTASTFLTYGLPIPKIKCNLNLNAGFSFSGTPGLVNGLRNVANTYNANAGFVLGSNISEKIDFTLSYTANYNVVRNTLQTSANSNYFNHTAGVKFNWLFWKGFVFNTNLLNNLYAGVSDGYNLDVFLWNASLGYKFLKDQSLEVKAGVNDILNQNTGITRTITDTYIEDSKTAVLKRYLLVTITYNIRYFNAGQKPGKVKGSVE